MCYGIGLGHTIPKVWPGDILMCEIKTIFIICLFHSHSLTKLQLNFQRHYDVGYGNRLSAEVE